MNPIKSYYQGTSQSPYHLSIGAVLRNQKGEIACHHFALVAGFSDIYLLMRETMEPGETIEDALHRGLLEEFGAKASIVGYLGSLISVFDVESVSIQKTTLYFLCELEEMRTEWRKSTDEEKDSIIEWQPVDSLIKKMTLQRERYGREDADESEVLERLVSCNAARLVCG